MLVSLFCRLSRLAITSMLTINPSPSLHALLDWIHDAIKHSLRLRRLRRLRQTQGLRGWLKNSWDGAQGWLLVTLIGFVTACIAYAVIGAEMVLFDLKEGYCETSWKLAKRFCCPKEDNLFSFNNTSSLEVPVALGGFMLRGWNEGRMKTSGEACENWKTWGQVWEDRSRQGDGAGSTFEYVFYVFLAVSRGFPPFTTL